MPHAPRRCSIRSIPIIPSPGPGSSGRTIPTTAPIRRPTSPANPQPTNFPTSGRFRERCRPLRPSSKRRAGSVSGLCSTRWSCPGCGSMPTTGDDLSPMPPISVPLRPRTVSTTTISGSGSTSPISTPQPASGVFSTRRSASGSSLPAGPTTGWAAASIGASRKKGRKIPVRTLPGPFWP